MSWQNPTGGFNPNAMWQPPQGQQGGYQQQGQGSGYAQQYQAGGYQSQYQGGYYPQQSYGQQGGYGYNQGYGGQYGYGAPQQGYGSYQPQNGYQQTGYQQSPNSQSTPTTPAQPEAPPAPQPSASDLAKLSLGGSRSTEEIVMPKKGKAKKITLGGPLPAPATGPVETQATTASPTTDAPKPDGDVAPSAAPQEEKKTSGPTLKKKSAKTYVRDPRPHFNVVFCGHVDAGKSTINGDLLITSGAVDEREMQKLTREAIANHREGWEKAYVMDLSEKERATGKTFETGAGYFETKARRITVLDAPGHKAFVPSMIGGATQADLAVMVISARRGEFEAGFENGGQTREHTTLLRTCGVKHLICVINKMDDCEWGTERYDEIVGKLTPFFKQNGFAEKVKNLFFMPVSGLSGKGIASPVGQDVCPWYTGPSLLEYIDKLVLPETRTDADPLCIPVVSAIKDDGKVLVCGKIESGSVAIGDEITVLPTKSKFTVEGIMVDTAEIEKAYPGDNVHIRVKGLDEVDFHPGFVLTQPGESADHAPLKTCEFFQAVVMILEVDNIISNGTRVVMHIHSAEEEVVFDKILATVDPKTLAVVKKEPAFAKAGEAIIVRLELQQAVCLEVQTAFDKMGRFILRDKGRTIAIGRVTKLYESTHESLKGK